MNGQLTINTENIFPIIKKFLYQDQDIFLRELVANAVDAIQKLQVLAGQQNILSDVPSPRIHVSLDSENLTLTISDTGLGMSQEEVMRYINDVAFSSAEEWLTKYGEQQNLIGHFGLGFYSAFMVAKKVEIVTQSYLTDNSAVHWICDGTTNFELTETTREAGIGTDIILHLDPELEEYLVPNRIRTILTTHCRYLPVPIYFQDEEETINDINPIWVRNPEDVSDEDYLALYNELYPAQYQPLFWIHLKIDYPFNFTGIIYFPKIFNQQQQIQNNRLNLYCNQVFVSNQLDGLLPDYMSLLSGVIDSPDIPLNVSRSSLQTDAKVRKISNYIARKITQRLNDMFTNERAEFLAKWPEFSTFVKYGMMRDSDFYERSQKFAVVRNTENNYFTLEEYKEKVAENQTDKNGTVIYLYTNDVNEYAVPLDRALKRGYDVLVLNDVIDNHWIGDLEMRLPGVRFQRIDAGPLDQLIDKTATKTITNEQGEEETVPDINTGITTEQEEFLTNLFANVVRNKNNIQIQQLDRAELPVVISHPEWSLRNMNQPKYKMSANYKVVINTASPIIQNLLSEKLQSKPDQVAQQLFNLSLLSQNMLSGTELAQFIDSSLELIQ